MRSIFQGEIDVFCAPYAVLNVLRHVCGIRLLACREILHETLTYEAKDPQNWLKILEQRTDYMPLVSAMLERAQKKNQLEITRPYARAARPEAEAVWAHIQGFLQASKGEGSVLFLFIRHLTEDRSVEIRHWTSAHSIRDEALILFDSSLNEGALKEVKRAQLVSSYEDLMLGKVCIIPYSLHCIRRVSI